MRIIPLLLVFSLFAQDAANAPAKSGTTGSIGTVTINGEVYNQLSLRPEIPIGKLGLGLDVYLYFNDKGMYWESWDFSSGGAAYRTIIDKIYYLRWGQPGENLYFKAGALPSVTLGQGILVNNYSNIMEYPQVRQIGFDFKAKIAGVGIELIHSNFKEVSPGVIGMRSSLGILPKLSAGISYVTDMDQNAGLKDSDGDTYPDYYDFYPDDSLHYDGLADAEDDWEVLQPYLKDDANFDDWFEDSKYYNEYDPANATKDPMSGVAVDLTYSLSNKITLYSQFAQLIGEVSLSDSIESLGWGLVPIGVRTKLGPVDILAEYRMNSRRFVFNYWDRAYDVSRVTLNNSGDVTTKESKLYQYGKLSGFYAQARMDVMNLLNLSIGYQNMNGEIWDTTATVYTEGESNQTFLTLIGINPSLIPKVGKAEAFYQQSNVPNPFEFEPNASTIWGYDVGVEVSSGVMLVYQARTIYIYDIDTDKYEGVESIQIETQFIF
jgi:hypothetical protein